METCEVLAAQTLSLCSRHRIAFVFGTGDSSGVHKFQHTVPLAASDASSRVHAELGTNINVASSSLSMLLTPTQLLNDTVRNTFAHISQDVVPTNNNHMSGRAKLAAESKH
jgi:hypothetical protein